jgi:hypothetical protein
MEAGDSSVSVDLLLRALFALGAKPRRKRMPCSVADPWLLDPEVTLLPRHALPAEGGTAHSGALVARRIRPSRAPIDLRVALDDFLNDFPSVTREQAIAALELAREMTEAHATTAR